MDYEKRLNRGPNRPTGRGVERDLGESGDGCLGGDGEVGLFSTFVVVTSGSYDRSLLRDDGFRPRGLPDTTTLGVGLSTPRLL